MAYRVFLLGVFLMWLPGALVAEVVEDLYSGEAVAADRSQQALDAAAQAALAQVFVKASGSEAVLENPALRAQLPRARGIVQQYAYTGPAEGGVGVRFEFSDVAVTGMITAAGAPLWTANRPAVLVWLALQSANGQAVFVGPDTEPALRQGLQAAFFTRGLPLRLPLHDLTDSTALRPGEVLRLYQPALEVASRRYPVEHVLAGRLAIDASGMASGEWLYLSPEGRLRASQDVGSEDEFMALGAGLVADALAARYAVAATGAPVAGIQMSVSGVDAYASYAAVVSWLEAVELIDSVRVTAINRDRIYLLINGQVDADDLAGIIALNPRLRPTASAADDSPLSYRWQN